MASSSSSSSSSSSTSSRPSSIPRVKQTASTRSVPPLTSRQVSVYTAAIDAAYPPASTVSATENVSSQSTVNTSSNQTNDNSSLVSPSVSSSPGATSNPDDTTTSSISVSTSVDTVDAKMAQYRDEMLARVDHIDERNRAAMQSFMSHMAQQQQQMFEQMMNKLIERTQPAPLAQDEDDDIHPSLRLSPLLSSDPSSSSSSRKTHISPSNE